MRTLGVISSKGGVGKTTVSINIAAALMKMGRNVVLVDSDLKMSGVGLQLGTYTFHMTLNELLNKCPASILESICIHSSGLRIVPASLCVKDAKLKNLRKIITQPCLKQSKVVVDTPPGIEDNVISILKSVDDVIIVTTPDLPSIADAMKSIRIARELNCNVLGLIVNRHRRLSQLRLSDIESACELPVLGAIPEDKNIQKSIFRRTPIVVMKPNSPASRSFREITKRLCEIEVHGHMGVAAP